ncbi:MAG: hypothetical protein QXO32_03825 [Candidatus Bathyarchaeia archaeon]
MDDKPVTSISVPVCEEFELKFLIELLNLPGGQGMVGFSADILWDGSQVEFRRIELPADMGWEVDRLILMAAEPGQPVGVHIFGEGPPWTESSVWALLVLHCRGPGTSKIVARSPPEATVWIGDGQTTPTPYEPTPWDVAVTQYTPPPPPPPPRPSNPVGGVVYSTGKLMVLSPYIALVGLASVVALAAKRRKR